MRIHRAVLLALLIGSGPVIAGCSDLIVATRDISLGMGGPAMIEGGNLGVFSPEEVGPMSVQVPNGTVDIAVEDEADDAPLQAAPMMLRQGRG